MNQEHYQLIIDTLVAGKFVGPEESGDALEILAEAKDPQSLIKILFDEMIPLPDRQSAIEMLIKNEKVREALRPEIHIHFLKYLIAIGMGFG